MNNLAEMCNQRPMCAFANTVIKIYTCFQLFKWVESTINLGLWPKSDAEVSRLLPPQMRTQMCNQRPMCAFANTVIKIYTCFQLFKWVESTIDLGLWPKSDAEVSRLLPPQMRTQSLVTIASLICLW